MTDRKISGQLAAVFLDAMLKDTDSKNTQESDADHLARLKREVGKGFFLPIGEIQWLVKFADRLATEEWEAREVLRRG